MRTSRSRRRRFVAAAIREYSKPATRTWGRDARPAVSLSQCQHEQPVRSLLAEFADSKMLLDSGAQASGHRLRRSRGRTQSSRGGKCFDPPRACLQKPTRRVLLRFEEEEEGDPPLLARAGKISPLQGVRTREFDRRRVVGCQQQQQLDRSVCKENRERGTEATEQEPVAAWWCVSTSSMAQYRRRKRGHECCRTLAASWAGRGTVVRGATDGDGGLA